MKKIMCALILVFPVFVFSQTSEKLLLNLEKVKELTLTKNPVLKISSAEIAAEKGIFWQEFLPDNPSIGIEVEETPMGANWENANEKRYFIEQTIDFPTNYLFNYKILNEQIKFKRFLYEERKRELIYQATAAYWQAVFYRDLVTLFERNLKLAEIFYQKAARAYELGEVDRLFLLKAKVNLSESSAELSSAKQDYKSSMSQLKAVLAIEKNAYSRIVLMDTLSFSEPGVNFDSLRQSLTLNPRFQAAQSYKSIATNARRLALGKFLPEFSISYFKQKIENNDFWGGEIGISVPLWFMKNAGLVQQRRAEEHMAEQALSAEKFALTKEFDTAVAQLEKAIQRVKNLQSGLLSEAEEVFRVANSSYAIGEIGYLEFIDAQQMLIRTKKDYLESLYQFQIEKANLARLTAIDW